MPIRTPFPPYNESPDWEWRVFETVRKALRASVFEAQSEIRGWLVRWDDLEGSGSAVYFEGFEGHEGDPARSIDGRAYFAMRSSLSASFDGMVHVRGEEDQSTFTIMPYELLVLVDPLDGTAPAQALSDSHASVALAYMCRPEGGFTLLGCAICSSSDIVVSWTAGKEVQRGIATLPAESDDVIAMINPARPGNLAVVAAKPADRALHSNLLAHSFDCVVYNTGGTPRTWALIGLELGSLVALKAQTPWDAAYLLPHVDTGGIVRTARGEETRSTVIQWFEGFKLTKGQTKVVPPHIAASSPESAEVAVRALGWEW